MRILRSILSVPVVAIQALTQTITMLTQAGRFRQAADREKEIARARIMADSSAVVGEKLNIRDAFRPFKDPMYW